MTSRLVQLCLDANDPIRLARFWAEAPGNEDQGAEVDRFVSLGAARIDIGQGDVSWVVMADPDGNEFCVLTSR